MNWMQLITGFTGSIGFAMLFNLHGKKILWTALGGLIAWFAYLLFGIAYPVYRVQFLVAGFVLGCYCEIMAILTKMPRTAYIAVGIIPLIPGAALYYTMYYAFRKDIEVSFSHASEAIITSLGIAVGLLISMTLWGIWRQARNRHKKSV